MESKEKERLFQFRLGMSEYNALKLLAKVEDCTLSEVTRRLIRDRSRELGAWPVQSPADVPAHVRQ